jgi:transposase
MGVDVSKDNLDTVVKSLTGELLFEKTFKNTVAGRKSLVASLRRYSSARVMLEATASFHFSLMYDLDKANVPFAELNPYCVKCYARSKNIRSKTDLVDAHTLADYGIERPFKPSEMPTGNILKLRQMSAAIRLQIKHRTATKNHLQSLKCLPVIDAAVVSAMRSMIKQCDRTIDRMKKEMMKLVKEYYAETFILLTSIKGIGDQTALILISFLGNLDSFESSRQVAHFMGIGNVSNQSGTRTGRRRISKRGHPELRAVLYMCALSAARYNTSCRDLYKRLLEREKPKKLAIIAVANKLNRQLFAVVKNKTPFENNYLEKPSFLLAS